MHNLKGALPFRLGATSYVIPDDIVPNVRHLAGLVDDIEILLFESDALSPLPAPGVIAELGGLARDAALSYTVHLPLDANVGALDETTRQSGVAKCLRAIDRTAPLSPHGYNIHFPAPPDASDPDVRKRWKDALMHSMAHMQRASVSPATLCVESLDYPFEWIEGVVRDACLSVCLDLGHAMIHGQSLQPLIDRNLHRASVVHLHGVDGNRDHRALSAIDKETIDSLLSRLRDGGPTRRVVTIEVFSEARLMDSLEVLAGWPGWQ